MLSFLLSCLLSYLLMGSAIGHALGYISSSVVARASKSRYLFKDQNKTKEQKQNSKENTLLDY